jgi:nucleotide-binding universal stress UspA family protein
MDKILVAYDGTAESEAALRLAAELATTLGAAIGMVSVAPTPSGGPNQPSADVSISERELLEASERLATIGSHAEIHRATGDPGSEIDRIAADNGYDAIVVGRRGLSTIGRLLRGTASDRVPARLPPTILVVGPTLPSAIRA